MGLHWDNGKENGNYYSILGYIGIMEKKMEITVVYSMLHVLQLSGPFWGPT